MLLSRNPLPLMLALGLGALSFAANAQENGDARTGGVYGRQKTMATEPSNYTTRRSPGIGNTTRVAAEDERANSSVVASPAKPNVKNIPKSPRPNILAQPQFLETPADRNSSMEIVADERPAPRGNASKRDAKPAEPYPVSTASAESPLRSETNANRKPGLRLAAPASPATRTAKGSGATATGSTITTTMASLGIVLGAFLAVAWVCRKLSPASAGPLPKEVLELLGRTSLGGRQQLQLIRLGNKLVLVAVSVSGVETISEVDDPVEVERMLQLCRREQPGSVSGTFLDLVSQLEKAPVLAGFVDRGKVNKALPEGGRK